MNKIHLPLEYNYRPAKAGTEVAPLIIMLHGYGSDENDLFSFASELPEKYAIFSLRAPKQMMPFGNAWYSIYFDQGDGKFNDDQEAVESRDLIAKVIDEIIQHYEVDANDITLLGFSQGTILSYSVAMSYPEKIRRVIGLSGYVYPAIFAEGYRDKDLSNLKIYSSHGSVDQVIPVEWARKTKPFFDELGVPCSYSEFPVGHGVAPQNFYEFLKWMEEN